MTRAEFEAREGTLATEAHNALIAEVEAEERARLKVRKIAVLGGPLTPSQRTVWEA